MYFLHVSQDLQNQKGMKGNATIATFTDDSAVMFIIGKEPEILTKDYKRIATKF